MKICGLQKLSLLDFPGKLAATVFTGGCNLRCPFCHNAALVTENPEEIMTSDGLLAFLSKRTGKLDGVCITGGEPLLQNGIEELMRGIRALGLAVKLDTNGTYPQKLESIISEGSVDYIAMDIKNSVSKYGMTCGIPDTDTSPIEKSISLIMHSGVPYEFRTTVVREFHTAEDIQDIAQMIAGAERYYLQTFKDSGGLIAQNLHPVPFEIMLKMKTSAQRYVKIAEIRGQ